MLSSDYPSFIGKNQALVVLPVSYGYKLQNLLVQ